MTTIYRHLTFLAALLVMGVFISHTIQAQCTAPYGDLPDGWYNSDIGNVGVPGSACYNSQTGAFVVEASGNDIWGTSDRFHFAFQQVYFDGSITMQANALVNTNNWAKAGIMIRESTSASSKHAFIALTPNNGIAFQRRIEPGGESFNDNVGGGAPVYMKLERTGDLFSAYHSADGISWTQIGTSVEIVMSDAVWAGIAVTSHNNSTLTTFDSDNLVFDFPSLAHTVCGTAPVLTVNDVCTSEQSYPYFFEGPQSSCADSTYASAWYQFVAPSSGVVTVRSDAAFNDVITLYENNCNSFTEVACTNHDAFGFEGEELQVGGLTAGSSYLIRLSGAVCTFGEIHGNYCISVTEGVSAPPTPPSNDICATAVALSINTACVAGNNYGATMDGPAPSLNLRSTNSIWYTFTAPADGVIDIETGADFSDVITVYEGSCGALVEIACNDFGHSLNLTGLASGQTYYIQVASNFVTIEGNVCISVNTIAPPPSNDFCVDAINVNVGDACTTGTNVSATYSGVSSNCEFYPENTIWYTFSAPSSGIVDINTGAEFIHTLSLFSGDCTSPYEIACFENPSKCDDPVRVFNLTPSQNYLVQIASSNSPFGYTEGDVCLRITDGGTNGIEARIKVMLEATLPSDTNIMTTTINNFGLVPTEQPYNQAPWNYNGSECVDVVPEDAIDWVLVEIRSQNATSVVDQKAALLMKDGSIIDANQETIRFANGVNGSNYFIVVRHRNHLDVLSATSVQLPNTTAYDFSTGTDMAYGNDQLKDNGNGLFTMYAGDVDGNGVIIVSDFNTYSDDISAINQYLSADINLDRAVTVTDYNYYQANSSIIGVQQIRY